MVAIDKLYLELELLAIVMGYKLEEGKNKKKTTKRSKSREKLAKKKVQKNLGENPLKSRYPHLERLRVCLLGILTT